MFPEPFLWYPLIIDCIPQSCASPTANFQPPFFSAQIKNQCDLGNRFSNGESNLDSSLNIDIKYSFYVYRFGLFEQGIIWVYIYIYVCPNWSDIIRALKWCVRIGIQVMSGERGKGGCSGHCEDILYRTSTPSFFWLKKYLLIFANLNQHVILHTILI